MRAGLLTGAAAILTPYHGIGLPDAAWAAAAGGSIALVAWRWVDLRVLDSLPVPPPPSPELAAAEARLKMINMVRRLPAGHVAIEEFYRYRAQLRLRGTSVADLWRRLDRASATLAGFRARLNGPAVSAVAGADVAEQSLRELAERSASIERASRIVAGKGAQPLADANAELVGQLAEGVNAYEQLVGAAATYLAEDSRTPGPHPAVGEMADAAELLRCVAESLSELRKTTPS